MQISADQLVLVVWIGAILVTLAAAVREASLCDLDPWRMYVAAVAGLAGAYVVGGLFGAAIELGPRAFAARHWTMAWSGSRSMFGALVGALGVAAAFLRIQKQPVLRYVDAAAPAVALGYALMRLSCALEGHCYGAPTAMPWGMAFPPGSAVYASQVAAGWIPADARLSLPVHPTQLYHAVTGLIGFATLTRVKHARPGGRLALALIGYGLARFCIEFFRGDAAPVWHGLDMNHLLCLVMIGVGLRLWRVPPEPNLLVKPAPRGVQT